MHQLFYINMLGDLFDIFADADSHSLHMPLYAVSKLEKILQHDNIRQFQILNDDESMIFLTSDT